MNLFRNIRSRQGFTLLELMIVVVIVGVAAEVVNVEAVGNVTLVKPDP